MTDPYSPPQKLTGFASVSGATSGKTGVDISTSVHPMATPLCRASSHAKWVPERIEPPAENHCENSFEQISCVLLNFIHCELPYVDGIVKKHVNSVIVPPTWRRFRVHAVDVNGSARDTQRGRRVELLMQCNRTDWWHERNLCDGQARFFSHD